MRDSSSLSGYSNFPPGKVDGGSNVHWPWVNQACVVIPSLGLLAPWSGHREEGRKVGRWGQHMEGPQSQAKNLH